MRYLILFLCLGLGFSLSAQQKANYRLAQKFSKLAFGTASRNSFTIVPHFIHRSDRFWFEFTTEDGTRYYYVDPGKRLKRLLFENADVAAAVSTITRKAYDVNNLKLSEPEISEDGSVLTFGLDGKKFEYNLLTKNAKQLPEEKPGPDMYTWMYFSPDSNYILYAKNHNLFVRGNKAKGRDTTEIQLTTEGELFYSYARNDEDTTSGETETAARWFKNSGQVYILRADRRKIEEMYVIDALARPRPQLQRYKYEMAGDKELPVYSLEVIDIKSRKITCMDIRKWPGQDVEVAYAGEKGDRIFFQRYRRTWDEVEVCVADTKTGESRVVIHEIDKPYIDYHMRNVLFLNDGKDILYRSERTGWGHFYLYDDRGNLKNTVTSGDWVAGQPAAIDTLGRIFYVYGHGREKGADPYYYRLYKTNLDTKVCKLLTPEDAMHKVTFTPSRRYFIDVYSTVETEPRMVLKDNEGALIMELAKPDYRRLYEMGWKKPERFCVKAADGITDLYGVMYKPFDFDSTKSYPIISYVYPGPHFEYVKTSFGADDGYNVKLAQLGFIVVSLGHRGGSPMRGKFYHRYGYGNFRDYPLADDKYALEQLADRYPFIDINRVGIFGHSGGGFMSTAAICTYPGFYKAAVSSSGNHDNNIYNNGWVEIHHGVKETKKVIKDSVNGDREEYSYQVKVPTNMELAKNLRGHLLLVTGDMDKNVNPAHTFRMAEALIKAGKNFDMLVLPGKAHGYGSADLFFERKMWFHFAKYLLGDDSADAFYDIEQYKKK